MLAAGTLSALWRHASPSSGGEVLCHANQLGHLAAHLGLGEGALADARAYTRAQRQPRPVAGTVAPGQDPYVLHHYGTMWVELEAARLVTDRAGEALQRAWERGDELTARERGECTIAVAAAKVTTTRAGLDVATRIFDVMSARATSSYMGIDRYWRNLRTHTLHDPVDYKIRELGDWALNEEIPVPSAAGPCYPKPRPTKASRSSCMLDAAPRLVPRQEHGVRGPASKMHESHEHPATNEEI